MTEWRTKLRDIVDTTVRNRAAKIPHYRWKFADLIVGDVMDRLREDSLEHFSAEQIIDRLELACMEAEQRYAQVMERVCHRA